MTRFRSWGDRPYVRRHDFVALINSVYVLIIRRDISLSPVMKTNLSYYVGFGGETHRAALVY